MNANAVSVLAIFEKKAQLEVPLFQRQYVWSAERQWQPLWEDISRKFSEELGGRTDAPVHFLGAMVLDQKQTPTTHVERRQVIDGQQRLTTLQVFLAAFRDYCRQNQCEALASEIETFTENRGMMAVPETDRFKAWPTTADRPAFKDVMTLGSRSRIREAYPFVTMRRGRRFLPRPLLVEAYEFFASSLEDFFRESADESDSATEKPIAERLEGCFRVLKNSLQVVAIDLDKDDDAQVIFETLNARGEPLLPADLLRNFIFLRAARHGESQQALYDSYWKGFDDAFWRAEIRQGRLNRPRSDLFLQHYLASQETIDIAVKHLFVEYKHWIEKARPFPNVREELERLSGYSLAFRRLTEPSSGDHVGQLAEFLRAFDISTVYPLLLRLMAVHSSEGEWAILTKIIESYLLRRAMCGLTAKNYNRIFLGAIRSLQDGELDARGLYRHLAGLQGESSAWPSDSEFRTGWRERHAYQTLQVPKILLILQRLNATYWSRKSEVMARSEGLTIEHLMPQAWVDNWPLEDGQKGLTTLELWDAEESDERTIATRKRNQALQTIGNLTLVTQSLNSSISNGPWAAKRAEILLHSGLPLNQQLQSAAYWDEAAITRRSEDLFASACELWPSPAVLRNALDV
jgi:hypothetical protein